MTPLMTNLEIFFYQKDGHNDRVTTIPLREKVK